MKADVLRTVLEILIKDAEGDKDQALKQAAYRIIEMNREDVKLLRQQYNRKVEEIEEQMGDRYEAHWKSQ